MVIHGNRNQNKKKSFFTFLYELDDMMGLKRFDSVDRLDMIIMGEEIKLLQAFRILPCVTQIYSL